jgi:DNA-3-methyladenine glycosylase
VSRIIKAKAWQGEDTIALARTLLGKYLVRAMSYGGIEAHLINEVEAYNGETDLASHARAGRTARTEVMYAAGGVWYVYLCYGIHEMLNLVVGPRDEPKAILIRGIDGVSGPGRLTRHLEIDRRLNAHAAKPSSGLWLEDRGVVVPPELIQATPRIGVNYAGPIWSQKPWRFIFDPRALPTPPPGLRPQKSKTARPHAVKRVPAE